MASGLHGIGRRWRRGGSAACVMVAALLAAVDATPAGAAVTDQGAGAVAGTVTFAPGAPLPSSGCTPEQFSLSATGAMAFTSGGTAYSGTINVSTALSTEFFTCASFVQDAGYVDVTVSGGVGAGSLACGAAGPLPALYIRWGNVLLVDLYGSCKVSGVTTPPLDVVLLGALVPTSTTPGLDVTSALYTATVSVLS